VTAAEFARDALARIVWIRESHEPLEREQALEDLEHDLASFLATGQEAE
jgi:hypothetical protein